MSGKQVAAAVFSLNSTAIADIFELPANLLPAIGPVLIPASD